MDKEEKYKKVLDWFRTNMAVAETELHYKDPYQLIVAVILSAQCTDKRVNIVTKEFFKRYPTAQSLSEANVPDIYELIKSVSYPNNKSKHLLGMSQTLVREFNGQVPDNIEDLQRLPGVGRKSANVIVSVIFKKPAMAVDTHVFRVAARVGLSVDSKTPLETERQLVRNIPENDLPVAHHWLILHGRYVCTARNPKCTVCGIKDYCDYYLTTGKI
jgi:endonuclease-3